MIIPVPFVTGTLLAIAVALAVALSPIFIIHSGLGPINAILCISQIFPNLAFSDKNPYPGWIASAPVISAAAMILGIFKYDSVLEIPPIQTASSANITCKLSLSASEYTATVFIPNSLAALIILTAISPLLAISIFLNITFPPGNPNSLDHYILIFNNGLP